MFCHEESIQLTKEVKRKKVIADEVDQRMSITDRKEKYSKVDE